MTVITTLPLDELQGYAKAMREALELVEEAAEHGTLLIPVSVSMIRYRIVDRILIAEGMIANTLAEESDGDEEEEEASTAEPPQPGRTWTDERVALLRELWAKGEKVPHMLPDLNALPGPPVPSAASVWAKATALKLPKRATAAAA